MQGDTPVHRTTITEAKENEYLAMLEGIRARRLKILKQKQEADEAKKKAKTEKLLEKYTHQLSILEKELTRLDKAIDKCEDRIFKIRAMRLEIEG